jgi:hypothetical protein
MTSEEAAVHAEQSFQLVLQHGHEIQVRRISPPVEISPSSNDWLPIQLDHWLVYHTHFELGRLFSQMGDNGKAKHHLELVLSGQWLHILQAHHFTDGVSRVQARA